MIAGLIQTLGGWNWIILGLILLGLEVLAPGTFILWLGMAALATGVITFIADPSWQTQAIAFALLSLVAVGGWWFYFRNRKGDAGEPVLHRRADMHIGRIFTLEEPIVGGNGRVRIDDSVWRISGPDLPSGARVRVASTDGAMLRVEAV
jgi:membrane protein implicated in regulation of membrane protease activity